jgi:hypothetical protein
LKRWRDSRWLLLGLSLVAACAVNAGSLPLGWFGDDFAHRRFILDHLNGQNAQSPWWDMFVNRADGGSPVGTILGERPWWASPDLSFALLRPLSVASHYLDYILWPEVPWLMHLHNVVLFCLVVLLAGDLYWRLMGSGVATWCALTTFVIDDAHTVGIAWIASRNTLLTAGFALLTLWLHHRGACQEGRWFPRAAPLALLAAHASSEGAVVAWAYLLAHAAFLDPRSVGARLRSLVPLAGVSSIWFAGSALLGYGVRGSGHYIDPRHDPIGFAASAVQRLPELLELQLSLPAHFIAAMPARSHVPFQNASIVYLGILACSGALCARHSRLARFYLVAAVLGILPLVATVTAPRLFLLSGFAAHGLIAVVLADAAGRLAHRGVGRKLFAAAWVSATLFVHVGVALFAPAAALAVPKAGHASVVHAAASLPAGAALQGATIMVLNFPDYVRSVFVGLYRRELFAPGPRRMHVLGVGTGQVRISRPSLHAIELEPVGGYLQEWTTLLSHRATRRFSVGQRFDLQDVGVEVIEVTRDGRPARIRVHGERLTHPSLLWVTWSEPAQRFVHVVLPEVGASRWLEGISTSFLRPITRAPFWRF